MTAKPPWRGRRLRALHAACDRPCNVRVEHHDGRVTECSVRPASADEMLTAGPVPPDMTVWTAVIPAGTPVDARRDRLTAGCVPPRTALIWAIECKTGMPPGMVSLN